MMNKIELFEAFKKWRKENVFDTSDFEPELLEGRDDPITSQEEFDFLNGDFRDWVLSGSNPQEFADYFPYDLADVDALFSIMKSIEVE